MNINVEKAIENLAAAYHEVEGVSKESSLTVLYAHDGDDEGGMLAAHHIGGSRSLLGAQVASLAKMFASMIEELDLADRKELGADLILQLSSEITRAVHEGYDDTGIDIDAHATMQ